MDYKWTMEASVKNRALIRRISQLTGLNRDDARLALNAVSIAIQEELCRGERVWIWGLGKFDFRYRAARKRPAQKVELRNEVYEVGTEVQATTYLKFLPEKPLRKRIREMPVPKGAIEAQLKQSKGFFARQAVKRLANPLLTPLAQAFDRPSTPVPPAPETEHNTHTPASNP